jgi:hypothetical protein
MRRFSKALVAASKNVNFRSSTHKNSQENFYYTARNVLTFKYGDKRLNKSSGGQTPDSCCKEATLRPKGALGGDAGDNLGKVNSHNSTSFAPLRAISVCVRIRPDP